MHELAELEIAWADGLGTEVMGMGTVFMGTGRDGVHFLSPCRPLICICAFRVVRTTATESFVSLVIKAN